VALVRDSRSAVRVYINGQLEINVVNGGNIAIANILLGRFFNGANDCTGYFDEVRYTKNVARYYGASFPVQIAQFPNS
jgi:hypothetical protein